jgi:sugar O-acyltransferase (sialic acid O-acetyltransferase NeuD family)
VSESLPIIVLGAGGHAKVVIDTLKTSGATILGITDPDPETHGKNILGVPVLGSDGISAHSTGSLRLANGIGSIGLTQHRREIFQHYKALGYGFQQVVHPSATVADDVTLEEGTHIMAGAVIQPGTKIGRNAIINTGASVDHDCAIADHAYIGADAMIGSGAVVIGDVAPGAAVNGVPARRTN